MPGLKGNQRTKNINEAKKNAFENSYYNVRLVKEHCISKTISWLYTHDYKYFGDFFNFS